MKKLNLFNVVLGLIVLGGAGYFIYVALSTDNLYKLGWAILLVAVSLCFLTAPNYSAACSGVFSLLVIPVSIIGIIAGIFISGENGSITMVLSLAGLGAGVGGLFLSVFLGCIAGVIVPTSDVEYSREKALELCREPLFTDKKTENDKEASVIGRAVVGGIIAGPAGAVIGAISAVDKNMRNNKQSDEKK